MKSHGRDIFVAQPYNTSVVATFRNVSIKTLYDRLGRTAKGMQNFNGVSFHYLQWMCNKEMECGPIGCRAEAERPYRPTPTGLTPFEEEMFDNTPMPEDGWTFVPCERHSHLFSDLNR